MRYYFDVEDDFLAVSDSEGTEYAGLEPATREAIIAATSIARDVFNVEGITGDSDREKRRQASIYNDCQDGPQGIGLTLGCGVRATESLHPFPLAWMRGQDLVNACGGDRGVAGADRDLVKGRDHVAGCEDSRNACALMLIDLETAGSSGRGAERHAKAGSDLTAQGRIEEIEARLSFVCGRPDLLVTRPELAHPCRDENTVPFEFSPGRRFRRDNRA